MKFFGTLFLLACFSAHAPASPVHDEVLHFTSRPLQSAQVGTEYRYQAVAVSRSMIALAITYHLDKAPEGMTIDSSSGLITWTPVSTGTYAVEVVARQASYHAAQSFAIRVVSFLGNVNGTVVNESGDPIPRMWVLLYWNGPVIAIHPMPHTHMTMTDSAGRYSISGVDSGSYFALATGCNPVLGMPCIVPEYADVWYQDSPDLLDATPIPITSSEPVTVDFTMQKRVSPSPVKVSGTVTDTSGNPVAHATVAFSRFWPSPVPFEPQRESESSAEFVLHDDEFGEYERVHGVTQTDSSGAYSLTLRSGMSYIASCFAKGYLLQFYNQKHSVLEADRIVFSGDSSGIDFRLVPRPVAQWQLSGTVRDTSGSGVPAAVVLHRRGSPFFREEFARCTHTDSLGRFRFQNLHSGTYLVHAIPFRGFLPSYYAAGECGTIRWRGADEVVIQDADVQGIDICVTTIRAEGAGAIFGHVRLTDGTPAPGVVVSVQSRSGASIRSYGVTESTGAYSIGFLESGSYLVSADKVDFSEEFSVSAEVTSGSPATPTDLVVTPSQTTTADESRSPLPARFELLQNYPNPFNPVTRFTFALADRRIVRLSVFNLLGQEVAVLVHGELSPGTHEASWDGSTFPSGIYFGRLNAGGIVETRKVVLQK